MAKIPYIDRVMKALIESGDFIKATERLLILRPKDPHDQAVTAWIGHVLDAYHKAGRPDLVEVSEMLFDLVHYEYYEAARRHTGALQFRLALFAAAVSASTSRSSEEPDHSDW